MRSWNQVARIWISRIRSLVPSQQPTEGLGLGALWVLRETGFKKLRGLGFRTFGFCVLGYIGRYVTLNPRSRLEIIWGDPPTIYNALLRMSGGLAGAFDCWWARV